jgi:hypothetical protein
MWTNRQLQMCLKIQVCSLNRFGRLSTVLSSESSGMYCLMMMEAAHIPETSVNIQLRTWQYIPGDSELHTRCRENLKSPIINSIVLIFKCNVSLSKTGFKHYIREIVRGRNLALSYLD